jgi:hypothetical protein
MKPIQSGIFTNQLTNKEIRHKVQFRKVVYVNKYRGDDWNLPVSGFKVWFKIESDA